MNTTQNKKRTLTGHTVALRAEHLIDRRINRRRLGIILCGAIAVCFAGATPPVAASDTSRRVPAASVDQSGVAAWAVANGLTGLSPASLAVTAGRAAAVDQSGIAAWADSNGLTGSSPASLRPIED